MIPRPIEKSFCTTREASRLLGVSIGTVQLWVESGLLQAWKTTGGHRRVLRHSIDALLRKTPASGQDRVNALPPARRLSVLVVEDDMNLLRLYQANISRWPMAPEVTCMDSAVMGLLRMGNRCPDLLITDLHMPGMDGFHMLRELRKSVEADKTTIAVVTGLDPADISQRGGLPPDVVVFPKPVPFGRLLDLATDIVQRNGLYSAEPSPVGASFPHYIS